jgi:hypothetical protein
MAASNCEKKLNHPYPQNPSSNHSKMLARKVRQRKRELRKTFLYNDLFKTKAKMGCYTHYHKIIPVVLQITNALLEKETDEAKMYLLSVSELITKIDLLVRLINEASEQKIIKNFASEKYKDFELSTYHHYLALTHTNKYRNKPWMYTSVINLELDTVLTEIRECEAKSSVADIKKYITETTWELGKFQKKAKISVGLKTKEVPRKIGSMLDTIKLAEKNQQTFLYTISELNIISGAGMDKFRFFDYQHKKLNRYVAINNMTVPRLGRR